MGSQWREITFWGVTWIGFSREDNDCRGKVLSRMDRDSARANLFSWLVLGLNRIWGEGRRICGWHVIERCGIIELWVLEDEASSG
jgi:hypothetical protein